MYGYGKQLKSVKKNNCRVFKFTRIYIPLKVIFQRFRISDKVTIKCV